MKRLLIVVVAALGAVGVNTPTTEAEDPADPTVIAPVEAVLSRPVTEITARAGAGASAPARVASPLAVGGVASSGTGASDPVVQLSQPGRGPSMTTLSAPLITWDGQGDLNPNDTVGDVGPDHFVQMVQENVQMWTKDGTSVAGPFPMSALWPAAPPQTPPGPCESDRGDPIVLYDNLAEQWLLSQFQNTNHICIAISLTSDPTGAYYLYDFPFADFPDYFKIGAWTDGYYMSFNGGSPEAVPTWVFDRDNMLLGNPAGAIELGTVPNLPGVFFDVLMPADIDGSTPPPAGSPSYFYRQVNGEVSGGVDRVDLYTATVDWGTATGTLSAPISVPLAAFDGSLCGYASFGCAPQPGTTSVLDPVNEIGMFRFPYRNYGDREVLAGNFAVDVNGADGHGIRWFVLERTGGGAWTVDDQGSFAEQAPGAPAFVHHFMGSVAMDRNGNLALAHTATSAQALFPSVRYTGRAADDPPGILQAEQTMAAGSSSLTSSALERWGDYYALIVDPVDDCTFWYTGDYGDSNGRGGRRQSVVGSFRFSDCHPLSAQVEASATNLVGEDHTFVLTAVADTPMGVVDADGATFSYSWSGSTAAVPAGTCVAAVSVNTCEVTVSSAVVGEGTLTIDTVSASVGGETFVGVVPAVISGGSLSATKKWIDAEADLSIEISLEVVTPDELATAPLFVEPEDGVAKPGDTILYTLTISNGGPNDATDALVTTDFPLAVSDLQVISDDAYVCQVAAQSTRCTLASHPVGVQATIVVSALVVGGGSTEAVATARVSAATLDPDLGNNQASATFTTARPIPPPGVLPETGADLGDRLRTGFLLVGSGMFVMLGVRRRRA